MMETPLDGRSYLERYLDCREAIKSPVNDLIDRAVAAGWTHAEVATALVNLAAELFPDSGKRETDRSPRAALRH
jgi:hypothetical protein